MTLVSCAIVDDVPVTTKKSKGFPVLCTFADQTKAFELSSAGKRTNSVTPCEGMQSRQSLTLVSSQHLGHFLYINVLICIGTNRKLLEPHLTYRGQGTCDEKLTHRTKTSVSSDTTTTAFEPVVYCSGQYTISFWYLLPHAYTLSHQLHTVSSVRCLQMSLRVT